MAAMRRWLLLLALLLAVRGRAVNAASIIDESHTTSPDISLSLTRSPRMNVSYEAAGLLNNLPQGESLLHFAAVQGSSVADQRSVRIDRAHGEDMPSPCPWNGAGLAPQTTHLDGNGPLPVLRPLKIANYRGLGSLDSYKVLAELGTVKHSQVLLFMEWCWYWAPGNSTAARCTAEHMPGADGNWSSWEEHLRAVVQRKLALRRQTPNGPTIWWDIWNEPNGAHGSSFWPPGAICNLTQCLPDAHFMELWRRAVVVLRATDPDPVIVGPSTDGFDWAYITEFLLYCRDHNVLPDVINWHELTPGSNGSEIPAHHQRLRAWLVTNGINGSLPFAHNEFVPATAHLIPAQTLGSISGATDAGAIGCVHSNWGPALPCNHSTGPANGLLTCAEQQPPSAPRAVWHVFAAYANFSGLSIPAQRHCDDCTALSSWDPIARTAQLLIGYYNGYTCTPATGKCIALPALPSRILVVEVDGMDANVNGTGSVRVNVAMIPNTGSASLIATKKKETTILRLQTDGRLVLKLNASLNAVLVVQIEAL